MVDVYQELTKNIGCSPDQLLALENIRLESCDTAYISGSLIEGYGNSSSDIDLFIIGQEGPSSGICIHKGKYTIAIHFFGQRRVDFEYWKPEQVTDIATKLAKIQPQKEFVAEKLDPIEEVFIHRIRIGQVLTHANRFYELKGLFDFPRFQAYLVQQSIHRIDGALEDLVGMIDDGDLDTALLRSRDLVGFVADAYSFYMGNTNSLPKWRARIIKQLPSDVWTTIVTDAFWKLQFPDISKMRGNAQKCRFYVEECIKFAAKITEWIQQ